MPEPADQPAKHGRSLIGFYVGLGLVAALAGLGVWLWTPMRIWYWERELRDPTLRNEYEGFADSEQVLALWRRRKAAQELVAIGPRASPAMARMMAHSPSSQSAVVEEIGRRQAQWALPLLAEACRNETRLGCRSEIVRAADSVTGESFHTTGVVDGWGHGEEVNAKAFLDWWEREGKAKYGGGEK